MRVILPDRSVRSMDTGACTIGGLLSRLGINPLEVVVSVNGRIAPEDTLLGSDDLIRIIRIAHGG